MDIVSLLTLMLQFGRRRFITCFVTVFATVIALTKDLADIEGDRQYNIETFATRLGPNRLALLGVSDTMC